MTSRSINQYAPDRISPPGDTLAETLEALSMSQAELASRLGRPRKTVNEIIKGKAAIGPETALQLESVLGTPAAFWMEREARYRESLARRRHRTRLAEGTDWARRFPFAAMAKRGWVPGLATPADRVAVLLRFFGVASPASWEDLWREREVAFRRSFRRAGRGGAIAAWLRQGEIEALALECAPFEREALHRALARARSLTPEGPEVFQPALTGLFASAGVALAWVPELEGAPISGATRWLSERKALIQLSLRYKTDDHLILLPLPRSGPCPPAREEGRVPRGCGHGHPGGARGRSLRRGLPDPPSRVQLAARGASEHSCHQGLRGAHRRRTRHRRRAAPARLPHPIPRGEWPQAELAVAARQERVCVRRPSVEASTHEALNTRSRCQSGGPRLCSIRL